MHRASRQSSDATRRPLIDSAEQQALIAQGRALATRPDRRATDDGRHGGIASQRLGHGLDFAEHRLYQPGDDPRRIDCRVTARTGHTHSRRFHDDRSADCLLLVDRRATMRFATQGRLKVTQAARVAIALAACFIARQTQLQLAVLDDTTHFYGPLGTAALGALARSLAAPCPPSDRSGPALDDALARIERQVTAGARLILLSDFADPKPPSETRWHRLQRRHPLSRVLISDPAEANPPVGAQACMTWALHQAVCPATQGTAERTRLNRAYQTRVQAHQALPGQHHLLSTTDDDLASLLRALT